MPPVPVPALELLFHVDAELGELEDHGITKAGHRRIVPIIGGAVSGSVEAQILPSGGDWQLVRPDGTVEVDTRYSLRTADGELLHVRTRGVRSGEPEVLEALLAGATVAPNEYYFRLTVEIESAAPRFAYLERSVIVAAAVRTSNRVIYDAYLVT